MANVPFIRESAVEYRNAIIAAYLGLSVDTAGRITDLNDGGVGKTFIEAIATAFERLDVKVFLADKRAIPIVLYEAFGDGDGVTTFVGFPLLPAIASSGIVRFQRQDGITGAIDIPLGTELQVDAVGSQPAKVYATIVPVTLAAADVFVETLAQATVTGTVGNTPANTMRLKSSTTLSSSLAGLESATNPQAFLSGAEAETEEGRFQRWRVFIRNLARAQEGGLELGALQATVSSGGAVSERALFARAVPVPDKRGLVDVFLDNGGGSASPDLVTAAQSLLDGGFATDGTRVAGYKAAGIVANVRAVVPQVVDVTCAIRLARGYAFGAVAPAVVTAIEAYLFGLGVFADLVLADLICAIVDVRGVADVVIAAPTANVSAGRGARIVAGAITVTELIA